MQEARANVRARVKQRAADIKEAALDLHENISDMVEDAVDDGECVHAWRDWSSCLCSRQLP